MAEETVREQLVELQSEYESFREHHAATEQSLAALRERLAALVEGWREKCRTPEGNPDGRGPIADTYRECADALAALLADK